MATQVKVPDRSKPFTSAALDVSDSASSLSKMADVLADRASKIRRAIRDSDPRPALFAGYIREYRYTAGREGEMPSHRFYIECGRGLWLYARVPSSIFEPIMLDMASELTGSALNGLMIVVQPDVDKNGLVPVAIVEDIEARDRFSNLLYMGAPVQCAGGAGEIRDRPNGVGEIPVYLDESGTEAFYPVNEVTRRF